MQFNSIRSSLSVGPDMDGSSHVSDSTWLRQLAAWLLCGMCAMAAFWTLSERPITVELQVSSSAFGDGQVFHSRNQVFTEPQSHPVAMIHDGMPHRYTVRIEGSRPPRWLRFDPSRGPGDIRIVSIGFSAGSTRVALDGSKLSEAVDALHDVEMAGTEAGLQLQATGTDPALRFAVPSEVRRSPPERIAVAVALLLASLGAAVFAARAGLVALRSGKRPPVAGLATGGAALGLLCVLFATGIEPALRPLAALRHGLPLFAGALAFALVGAVFDADARGKGTARLFLWLLLGQTIVMAYLQIRSLVTMATGLPVTQLEVFALPAIAAWVLVRSRHMPRAGAPAMRSWLPVQLALLLVLCLLVADRELPRLVMLSSDPDQHAFFARQLQRIGGLPWQQGAWGDQPLNYPGGTALLGAAWSWLSWSDPRNVVTALPWILYFGAALAVADAASERVRSPIRRVAVVLGVTGVLAAGLLLPLYRHFVHQEGLGRILAFGFLVLIAAPWLIRPTPSLRFRFACGALGIFAIAALNPISLAGAAVLLGAMTLWALLARRHEAALFLCLPAGAALAVVDPYYLALLGIQTPGIGVSLGDGFSPVAPAEGVMSGLRGFASMPHAYLVDALRLLPSAGWSTWLVPSSLALLLMTATIRKPPPWRIVIAVLAAVLVVALTNAIASRFTGDPRFYLLAAYTDASFAQLRILCALGLVAIALSEFARRDGSKTLHFALWGGTALIVVAALLAGRATQPWMLDPKWNYCGGLICPHPDDVATLEAFQREVAATPEEQRGDARLLTLNAVRDLGRERWLMPVGGARLAPFLQLPPAAFFYFQADAAYTTENYERHVCRDFDRDWLVAHSIEYIFLPANRAHGCLADADTLIRSEEIVAHHGDAYVLRLRPTSGPEVDTPR